MTGAETEAAELAALRPVRWRIAPERPENSTIQGEHAAADLAVAAALLADFREREPGADWVLYDRGRGGVAVDLGALLDEAFEEEYADSRGDMDRVAVLFLEKLGRA